MIWSEFIIFYGAAEQAGGSTLAPTLRSSQGALSPLLIPRAKSGLARAIYLFSFSTHLRRDFPCLPVQSLEGAASTNAPPVEISDWLIFSSSSAKRDRRIGDYAAHTAHSIFGTDNPSGSGTNAAAHRPATK
jgi:hypothetical protein